MKAKGEFRKIVKDTLAECSAQNADAINMSSEASQDFVAKMVEERIKAKFHIFRINRLMTGD